MKQWVRNIMKVLGSFKPKKKYITAEEAEERLRAHAERIKNDPVVVRGMEHVRYHRITRTDCLDAMNVSEVANILEGGGKLSSRQKLCPYNIQKEKELKNDGKA